MIKALPILLLMVILLMPGCGPDPGLQGDDPFYYPERLAGTWRVSMVSVDGVRKVSFDNAAITFSPRYSDGAMHYSFRDLPDGSPLPPVGTIKFGSNPDRDIFLVGNNLPISYSVAEPVLEMAMSYATPQQPSPENGGGIILPIRGTWVFSFTR